MRKLWVARMKAATYARFPQWLRVAYWFAWLYWPVFRSPVVPRRWAPSEALDRARILDRLTIAEGGPL